MNKFYILASSALLSVTALTPTETTAANAKVPFLKTTATPRAIPSEVVVSEDFSLFSAGSENEPDATDITVQYMIPDEYMHSTRWPGGGVHQAGGACALRNYVGSYGETRDGFISTPVMELYGDVTLTFRAKRETNSHANLDAVICDDYYGPLESRKEFTLTDEWQTYTYTTNKGSFDPCNIQITTMNGNVLIDDIRVERVRNRIATPYAMNPENISLTEFKAQWEPVNDAKDYLLNVYYTEMPANPVAPGSIFQNFDGINLNLNGTNIDILNPNYPEGWTIDVSSQEGAKEVSTEEGSFNSAPLSLVLDAEGEAIISEETPADINHISFWVKASTMDEEDDTPSMISVSVYHTHTQKWEAIANMPNYYLDPDTWMYEFDSEQIGDYVNRIKIEYIQTGDMKIGFMIDDIKLDYETQPQPVSMIKDMVITDATEYTVSDIDPEKDYFYYVQARDGEVLSEESTRLWVNGLTGLKPTVKEATDVTATGFTANWERMPKAATYSVAISKSIEAKENMTGVTILSEDFNKIADGTVSNPGTTYGNLDLGEKGMANTGWVATQPIWAEGMIGSSGTSWYGTAGIVASPMLSLNNNNGQFTVTATVYNTVADDVIWVMILKTINDQQSIAGMPIQCGSTPGPVTNSVTFPSEGQEDILIAFMSQSGKAFFVDEATILQDLKAGEKVSAPYGNVSVEGDNFYHFADLPTDADYTYTVKAMRTRAFENYTSEVSDPMIVRTSTSGIGSVEETEATTIAGANGVILINGTEADMPVIISDMQGRIISAASTEEGITTISVAPGIYVVKAGNMIGKVAVK